MDEPIILKRDGEIATILLNRPKSFNALDVECARLLANHLITLAADDDIRAVVISGQGKAFCAGGDIEWMLGFPQGPGAAIHELAARFHQAVLEIRRMPKPVIAAVNGLAAAGGLSAVLACDFRVMSESAVLRQAYTSNGLTLDGGSTFTLPRLVGWARALEIVAFDKPISAEQALAWGLATKVVKDGTALEEALNMAHELAKKSVQSFGWSKRLINDSFNTPFETQIERERASLCQCIDSPDGREGTRAFIEKRKPVFPGR